MPADNDPVQNFRYRLEIDGIDQAGFSEISGLASEYDVIEYREGSDPVASPRKLVGLRKFANVTLKRGVTRDKALWEWHDAMGRDPEGRRDVRISLLSPDGAAVCRWRLRNAWPARYEGPLFDAEAPAVAIETLTLAHEGLDVDGD